VELNSVLGLAARWTHLASCLLVVGAFAAMLLAGRSEQPTALAWEARVLRLARRLLLVALATGVAVLAHQAAVVEGRGGAALEPRALARLALETQGGLVWLARHGLLVLLAAFVALPGDTSRRVDWLAARGESALLAAIAVALLGVAGHAAAVEPATGVAIAMDAAHLVAAGVWMGALPAVAALLGAAARPAGADARPHAVLAVRRFSRLALAAVLVLAVSGAWNTTLQVGSVAGLVGTPYGRLLLVKLALVVAVLGLAALNRRLLPALSGDGDTIGRPAMRRLAAAVAAEAALALLVLGAVAALGTTPPAAHVQPAWPFTFRLSTAALGDAAARTRALVGSQVLVLGAAAALAALVLGRRRAPLAAAAAGLVAAGAVLLLPPLAIDAYPTTYRRPTVAYHAASIAEGQALYGARCQTCHGPTGAGDGPAARGLPRPPADLRAPHAAQHTAGDLYWWITNGIPARGMPGVGDATDEEQRWSLVNFARALGAAEQARGLGPTVSDERAIVAPDFTFTVGPTPARALKDYRGRRLVLLVLYTLPASRARLAQLARAYPTLATLGVEVIAVPRDAAPDAIGRLGPDPPILFPVVTGGAADVVAAYGLFAATPHAELLIDRQGWLRARWAPAGEATAEINALLAEVQALNQEKAEAPAPEEHVH
jgi:putative copper resistance protein D